MFFISDYLKKIAERKKQQSPSTVPSQSGTLWFVKHDFQMNPVPDRFNKWQQDPETVPELSGDFMKVTTPMLDFMMGIQSLFVPTMSHTDFISNFKSLYRSNAAFSNGHPYPNNFSLQALVCGGATLKHTGKTMNKFGQEWMEFYAINVNNIPSLPTSADLVDWTLFFRPTIFHHTHVSTGGLLVDAFPMFNNRSIVPIFSKTNTIWMPSIRMVQVQSIQNPFNPAFLP